MLEILKLRRTYDIEAEPSIDKHTHPALHFFFQLIFMHYYVACNLLLLKMMMIGKNLHFVCTWDSNPRILLLDLMLSI